MIPATHNLAPFPDGISGPDLLERMRSNAMRHGAAIEFGTVTAVEKLNDSFRVTTDLWSRTARSVILATGVVNHRPPLSVMDHDRGLARGLIRYCPVCDAYEVRGKRIAVLGRGAHGFAEARFIDRMSGTASSLLSRGIEMQHAVLADPPDGEEVVAALEILDPQVRKDEILRGDPGLRGGEDHAPDPGKPQGCQTHLAGLQRRDHHTPRQVGGAEHPGCPRDGHHLGMPGGVFRPWR